MNGNTYKDIVYHIVFSTKRKSSIITFDIMKQLRNVFKEKAADCGYTIHIANGNTDHVHVLISSPPKQSVSEIVKNLKGYSSYKIPKLYWQRGFGVFTVDQVSFDTVFYYIKNQ